MQITRMSLTQHTETNAPLPVVINGKRVKTRSAVAKFLLPDIQGTYLNLNFLHNLCPISDMSR